MRTVSARTARESPTTHDSTSASAGSMMLRCPIYPLNCIDHKCCIIMTIDSKVKPRMKASLALSAVMLVFLCVAGRLISEMWKIPEAISITSENSTVGEGDLTTSGNSSWKTKYLRRLVTSSTEMTPNPTGATPQIATTKQTTSNPRTARPTSNPNTQRPTRNPITQRPTKIPTATPTERPTFSPTTKPTLSEPLEPQDPKPSYFNFNTTEGSLVGPSAWNRVDVSNSYWSEFGFVANQCNDKKVTQSPIDVCTAPERHCLEYHEPRPNVRYTLAIILFCAECSLTLFVSVPFRIVVLFREETSRLLINT